MNTFKKTAFYFIIEMQYHATILAGSNRLQRMVFKVLV